MKKLLVLIISSSTALLASCQELKSKKYTLDATVVNQDGVPVEGAAITGGNEKIINRDTIIQAEYESIQAKTNPTGRANLTRNPKLN
jgi:hypothetical protein